LELSNELIPWGTSIENLASYGQPLINQHSDQRTDIIWQREKILNGLSLDLVVMQWNGIGKLNNKFKHAYGSLSQEGFEREKIRLSREFGQEAKYRRSSDLEHSYTWDIGKSKVVLSQLERFGSYWQVDIQHKSSWYGFLK
jgi:hypothetical protein